MAEVQQSDSEISWIAEATVEQAGVNKIINDSVQGMVKMIREIASSSADQQMHTGATIAGPAERLKDLTNHIRQSADEQANAGNMLTRAAAETLDTVKQMRFACDSGSVARDTFTSTLDDVQKMLSTHTRNIKSLESSVAALKERQRLLEKEIL